MNIGFTYDLRTEYLAAGYGAEETAEFDQDSTIEAIEAALGDLGHHVDRIGRAQRLVERLALGDRWDLVFNICEGLRGAARESQVPAILDVYDIPYTFSDPATLAVCLDKALTKLVLKEAGLPTPDWHLVRTARDVASCTLPPPWIVKPLAEGTGKGIDRTSIVTTSAQLQESCQRLLRRYEQPALVERYLPGREFTVGVLGTGENSSAIGTLEIVLLAEAEQGVYSYGNKEHSEQLVECRLASGRDAQVAEAERIALAAWRVLGGRDAGRVDIRCDENGRPQIMELNPLAGLHPTHSDLPMLWTALGRRYEQLIEHIVQSARQRMPAIPAAAATV